VAVEQLTSGLFRVLLGRYQAYVWHDADGATLIDTGAADTGGQLAHALDEIDIEPQEVRRVVLTHFHEDHAGAAAEVRGWGEVEVVASPTDAAVLRGDVTAPEPVLSPANFALHRQLTSAVPPAPPVVVDREVTDGDVLDFGGGARVIAVPGHTGGSIAVHLPEHGVLLTGDAVIQWAGRILAGVFNTDDRAARASLARLGQFDFDVAALGHGNPLLHNAQERLRHAISSLEQH
jgi:glyoxylase-like metal-dependent hydrolase (beta-lactamase superfamily II)